jgi:serine/threonine-protein kinase
MRGVLAVMVAIGSVLPATGAAAAGEHYVLLDGGARRFRVAERLGNGYWSIVHRGHDVDSGEPVALKFRHPDRLAEGVRWDSYDREHTLATRLSPHTSLVARSHGIGTRSDQPGSRVLVLELAEGEPLGAEVNGRATPRRPPARAARVVQTLLGGMQVLHDHNVRHNDFNPRNLVMAEERWETVRILDLGNAQRLDQPFRSGSSPFHPPEAFDQNNQHAGPGVDIFGAGALLLNLVSGAQPSLALVSRLPDPIGSDGNAQVLEAVIRRALDADPALRFPTASEMSLALDAVR